MDGDSSKTDGCLTHKTKIYQQQMGRFQSKTEAMCYK